MEQIELCEKLDPKMWRWNRNHGVWKVGGDENYRGRSPQPIQKLKWLRNTEWFTATVLMLLTSETTMTVRAHIARFVTPM